MAPPLRIQLLLLLVFVSANAALTVSATSFPLPAPQRQTTFPLSRPNVAGEVIAWGKNDYQQISVPSALTNVVAVSAGDDFTLALRADGTVAAWGRNHTGQTNIPPGLTGVVAISAGRQHSAALKQDGTVVCWGENYIGQSTVPSNLSDVVAIAAGEGHTLALKATGVIAGWGNMDFAQNPRVPYSGLGYAPATNVILIAAGASGSFALLADDRTVTWGQYIGLEGTNRIATALITDAKEVAAITFNYGPLVLRRDGILSPANNLPLNLRPVAVSEGYGSGFKLALNGDGSVTTWGDNSEVVALTPPRLRGVVAIAAGANHAVVVKLPTPPTPTQAKAAAVVVNGFIVGLNLIDAGEGYAVPPQVTITGGGGSGAAATAQISKGIVTGFTMTSAGIGYTSAPTVQIESPPILPTLGISTSRVGVTMKVVPGKRYQLESSNDLPNFSPVGDSFTATTDTITQEFIVAQTGQYFRIQEAP